MISMQQLEEQLTRVGCNFKLWGRSEIRELCNVLMPQETIAQAANGTYEGGFALICVTNYRVLLIDRKPMLLTIEDLRYDMISEVDYYNRMLGARVRICTPMRNLEFSSWSSLRLRKCVNYIQQRVMELRSHGFTAAQQLQTPVNGLPPSPHANPYGGWHDQSAYTQAGSQVDQQRFVSPYTKTPILLKRRRFPSFY